MKLSIIIPAYNEESCIQKTINQLVLVLNQEQIHYEILVVNDKSTDQTSVLLHQLSSQYKDFVYIDNIKDQGFGMAVRTGLENCTGDVIAIYMADESYSPKALIKFYEKI